MYVCKCKSFVEVMYSFTNVQMYYDVTNLTAIEVFRQLKIMRN